jgi:hypothetical protein
MTTHAYFILAHPEARRRAALYCEKAPDGCVVRFVERTRTLDQNARLWSMLADIADQVQWPVDGVLQKLPPEDWKTLLSAGVVKATRVAQGIDGGFVMLGQRTSKMTVRQMSDLIEFIQYFGDERGVQWTEVQAKGEGGYVHG